MGELHLEIIVDRLTREFKGDAIVGQPQVAYRETISKPSEKDLRYAQAITAAAASMALLSSRSSAGAGAGYEFVNSIVGGVIPKEYIPALTRASRMLCSTASWPVSPWSTSRSS
jgi:elongation factor G